MWCKQLFILFLLPSLLRAEEELTLPLLKKKRLDFQYNYQRLDPHKTYGNIQSGVITFSHPITHSTTFLYNLTVVSRKEGRGVLGQVGGYHDWHERLYTYTALTTATRASFLPKVRLDQEFYIKLAPEKNIVIPASGNYVCYYNNQKALTFGTGVVWYLPRWILEYRIFLETNYTNKIRSFSKYSVSQTISAGYGQEGWQWLFLKGGYGKNSNLAELDVSRNINQRVAFLNLNWRKWVFADSGFVSDLRYTSIKNAYSVYSFSLGLFVEF